jgi:ABC-type oligopeptide transport system ATPase subunit
MEKRGLLLVVGATGSGKSTTLASMIDSRNEQLTGHILTIEDPVEYQFKNKKSIVNQREIGSDTQSLQTALKNALRQAPDVILIGEIRDRETMSAAIAYAQSGHLCLATLHGNNSYHALNRILSFYPVEVRPTMLGDLASALKAMVSQRLVRTVEGGRVPAVEVMLNTKLVAELMEKGDFSGVKEAMEKSMAEGSQTFEEDMARLIMEGKVDRKEGLAYADSPTNLMWRLQNDFALAAKPPARPKKRRGTLPTTQPPFTESCWTSNPPDPVSPSFSDVPHPAPGRTAHLPHPSITPEDAGCLDLLAARLAPLGFVCERLDSGPDSFRVSNLWSKRPVAHTQQAQAAIKTIVFAGHTDVVPTGPLAQWTATLSRAHAQGRQALRPRRQRHENLHRRLRVAVEEFLAAHPDPADFHRLC